jgi:hypothetical protein
LSFPQRIVSNPEISGNKPISPFGLIGNCSTDLKKELDHNFGKSMQTQIQDNGINQFIWDFVIDMSPLKISSNSPQSQGIQETDELISNTSGAESC